MGENINKSYRNDKRIQLVKIFNIAIKMVNNFIPTNLITPQVENILRNISQYKKCIVK